MNQQLTNSYAPTLFGSPNIMVKTDYSVFKQTDEQKSDAIAAKWQHKIFMNKNGINPKKHLNIPIYRLEQSIKFST